MKALLSLAVGAMLVQCAVVPEGTCSAPSPPVTEPTWPGNFTAQWNEQTNFTGTMKYSGGDTVYAWNNGTNPAMSWHRWDGWADPYCNNSLPLPYDSQCSHIVVGGKRYLHYPILNKCCFCCNDAQGCGVPKPTFMNNIATNQGYGTYYGIDVTYWKFNEFIYAETRYGAPTERSWVGLWSQNDTYSYVWSFDFHADPIVLPSICAKAANCPAGPCKTRRAASPALPPIYFN